MPRRYKTRKRKTYKRRRRPRKSSSVTGITTVSSQNPLRKTLKTVFRYSEPNIRMLTLSGGGLVSYVFRANSIYDPDYTATLTGHQPTGFDQLMVMYNHYTVISANITVTFQNPSKVPLLCLIDLSGDPSPSTDVKDVIENGSCTYAVLPPQGADDYSAKTLKFRCNPNKFMGISKPMSNGLVRGSGTTNPSEGCYFHVYLHTSSSDSPVAFKVPINVTLEYVTILTEPENPGTS